MTAVETRQLPDALLDPAAYPHLPDSVELHETHISWVFVAGDKAYKVKKPVKFPFLDYSTVARRRAFCHAEADVNRRFAPALYRGVVGLVPRGIDGLRIAPEHDPGAVEYAVVMGRFEEAATLRSRLDAGTVAPAEAEAVGRAVAGFHAAAPAAPSLDGLGDVIEETLTTLRSLGAPARRLDDLERFCHSALVGFAPEMVARAARGLVRDGHGDLRAEHILPGETVQAVDAIEFDPVLRVADVGYDLAFLVMDVARWDDALARELVRGYRAGGGDPGSEGLLAFFCVVRALVRAKVDLLRAQQLHEQAEDAAAAGEAHGRERSARAGEANGRERSARPGEANGRERSARAGEAREKAARGEALLELAERFAWRARLPRVVCLCGFAASGKSTVAELIAQISGRTILASDRIRKLRAGIDPLEKAAPSEYTDAASRAVYSELAQRAATVVRREGGVVIDATFRRDADAEAFIGGSRVAAEAAWIVCEAPPEVLIQRAEARARGASISDAGPRVVAAELAVHRGPFRAPRPELARLDTTLPTGELLERLGAELDSRLASLPRHHQVPA